MINYLAGLTAKNQDAEKQFHFDLPSYRVQGFEVIYQTLCGMFLCPNNIGATTQMALPMSPNYLVQKVLVPETEMGFIAQDLKTDITDPIVYKTLENSRAYGAAVFLDQGI